MSKGLNFIPTKNTIPLTTIKEGLQQINRNLLLKDHFGFRTDCFIKRKFTFPNNWTPNNPLISTKDMIDDIETTTNLLLMKFTHKGNNILLKHPHNTSKEEFNIIQEIKNNENIIIKPCDKGGGAFCIMNKKDYINEVLRQLNDTNFYEKTEQPIWLKNKTELKPLVNLLLKKNFINKKQLDYLMPPINVRQRLFYILPKIHKPKETWPSPNFPAGRPIISNIDSENYHLSEYVDSFLHPLSLLHPSYIKDSFDFINKIKNKRINPDTILVTFDVNSLYTNMNLQRTFAVVKQFFNRYPNPDRPDKILLEIIRIILFNNDFRFGEDAYLQKTGIPMGLRFSSSLAELYLDNFDFNLTSNHPFFTVNTYFRYLDDGFLLWEYTIAELQTFETFLNKLIPGIKIKIEYNDTFIDFLDLTIYKTHTPFGTFLNTKTFFKPTNTHALLHKSSFHAPHTADSVIYSQLIRYKRISTNYTDFLDTCKHIFNSLSNR